MSIFEPLTLGYDWEVWALKHEMQPGDEKKVEKIADRVNEELAPIECHREWHFIEMGPAVTRDWTELRERTNRYVDWVQAEFAKEELFFYPCGAIVSEHGTAGLHIHVGTVGDAESEVRVVNALVRYIPALLALMVNSPVSHWRHGKSKSYRMNHPWGSGGVYSVTQPHLCNAIDWGDVCFRRSDKPTIEIRLADSCMSTRLLCEYAVVVAGLVDWIATHPEDAPASYTEAEYTEFLIDRWQATKHGLQATFTSGGVAISAADGVREIIDKATAGMRKLGASVEDLVVIPKMLEKRQTQADFQLAYLEHYPDLIGFTHAFANVLTDLSAFERYLDMARALPQSEPTDLDEAILEKIGRDTSLSGLTTDPFIPPVLLERRLRALESAGRISVKTTPEDGIKCSRLQSSAAPLPGR